MPFCANCGAQLEEGNLFCGECGAPVSDTVPKREFRATEETPRTAPQNPAPEPNVPDTAQPVWAQYLNQPQGQPAWNPNNGMNATTQPTFTVPQRKLGKGGGITMIIFGSILIFSFICGLIGILATGAGYGSRASASTLVGPVISLVLTVLGGGLLLLIFGIRKIKNVNRHNNSIR